MLAVVTLPFVACLSGLSNRLSFARTLSTIKFVSFTRFRVGHRIRFQRFAWSKKTNESRTYFHRFVNDAYCYFHCISILIFHSPLPSSTLSPSNQFNCFSGIWKCPCLVTRRSCNPLYRYSPYCSSCCCVVVAYLCYSLFASYLSLWKREIEVLSIGFRYFSGVTSCHLNHRKSLSIRFSFFSIKYGFIFSIINTFLSRFYCSINNFSLIYK